MHRPMRSPWLALLGLGLLSIGHSAGEAAAQAGCQGEPRYEVISLSDGLSITPPWGGPSLDHSIGFREKLDGYALQPESVLVRLPSGECGEVDRSQVKLYEDGRSDALRADQLLHPSDPAATPLEAKVVPETSAGAVPVRDRPAIDGNIVSELRYYQIFSVHQTHSVGERQWWFVGGNSSGMGATGVDGDLLGWVEADDLVLWSRREAIYPEPGSHSVTIYEDPELSRPVFDFPVVDDARRDMVINKLPLLATRTVDGRRAHLTLVSTLGGGVATGWVDAEPMQLYVTLTRSEYQALRSSVRLVCINMADRNDFHYYFQEVARQLAQSFFGEREEISRVLSREAAQATAIAEFFSRMTHLPVEYFSVFGDRTLGGFIEFLEEGDLDEVRAVRVEICRSAELFEAVAQGIHMRRDALEHVGWDDRLDEPAFAPAPDFEVGKLDYYWGFERGASFYFVPAEFFPILPVAMSTKAPVQESPRTTEIAADTSLCDPIVARIEELRADGQRADIMIAQARKLGCPIENKPPVDGIENNTRVERLELQARQLEIERDDAKRELRAVRSAIKSLLPRLIGALAIDPRCIELEAAVSDAGEALIPDVSAVLRTSEEADHLRVKLEEILGEGNFRLITTLGDVPGCASAPAVAQPREDSSGGNERRRPAAAQWSVNADQFLQQAMAAKGSAPGWKFEGVDPDRIVFRPATRVARGIYKVRPHAGNVNDAFYDENDDGIFEIQVFGGEQSRLLNFYIVAPAFESEQIYIETILRTESGSNEGIFSFRDLDVRAVDQWPRPRKWDNAISLDASTAGNSPICGSRWIDAPDSLPRLATHALLLAGDDVCAAEGLAKPVRKIEVTAPPPQVVPPQSSNPIRLSVRQMGPFCVPVTSITQTEPSAAYLVTRGCEAGESLQFRLRPEGSRGGFVEQSRALEYHDVPEVVIDELDRDYFVEPLYVRLERGFYPPAIRLSAEDLQSLAQRGEQVARIIVPSFAPFYGLRGGNIYVDPKDSLFRSVSLSNPHLATRSEETPVWRCGEARELAPRLANRFELAGDFDIPRNSWPIARLEPATAEGIKPRYLWAEPQDVGYTRLEVHDEHGHAAQLDEADFAIPLMSCDGAGR